MTPPMTAIKFLEDEKPSCRFAYLGDWGNAGDWPHEESTSFQQRSMVESPPSYHGGLEASPGFSQANLFTMVEGLPSWRICGTFFLKDLHRLDIWTHVEG